jgi:hypothetical protein
MSRYLRNPVVTVAAGMRAVNHENSNVDGSGIDHDCLTSGVTDGMAVFGRPAPLQSGDFSARILMSGYSTLLSAPFEAA